MMYQQLFQGTGLGPKMIAICNEFQELKCRYPELEMVKVPANPQFNEPMPYIQIQGFIPLQFNAMPYKIPIIMRIPIEYNLRPPIVSIPFVQGFPGFFQSPGLMPNGLIQLESLLQWNVNNLPPNALLATVNTLIGHFSIHPPININSAPMLYNIFGIKQPAPSPAAQGPNMYLKQFHQAGIAEANQLLKESYQKELALYNSIVTQQMLEHLDKTLDKYTTESEEAPDIPKHKAPKINVPPQLEDEAEREAEEMAIIATLEDLREQFSTERIDMKIFMEKTKELAKRNFNEFLYPRMKERYEIPQK